MLTAPERPPASAWPGRAAREPRPGTPVLGMLVVVLAVAAGTWATWTTTIDDAYITYRYALNWASGAGPVWNPGGDPVEGFTNFAWTAWHVPFIALGADPAAVSKVTSAVCAVAIGWLLLREVRTRAGRFAAVGSFLLFLPTYLHVVAGLETVAFALVVLRAVVVGRRVLVGRDARACELPVLLLLAGTLRPEGALAVAPAVLCLLRVRGGERAVRVWTALAGLAGAAYFLWRWSFFGHLLPNTFYVKFGHLDAGRTWVESTAWALAPLLVLLAVFAVLALRRPAVGATRGADARSAGATRGADARSAGATRGADARSAGATRGGGVLALTTVILLWLPYALSGPSMDYLHRFAFHAVPVLCLAAGLALDALGSRRIAGVLAAVTVGWTAVAGVTASDAPAILNYGADLQRTHAAIGRGLVDADVPAAERTLAVSDAGAIPFYSRWDAIDYIGLNDEAIAHGASPTRVVGDARPTVIVVTGGPGGPPARAYGMDVPAVTAGYERVASVWLRQDYWQYVFVREEFAVPVGTAVRAEVGRAQADSDGRWDETFDRWADRVI